MQGLAQVRPVDPVLTNYGLEFLQGNVWAADAAFPFVQTQGDTGTYYIPDALNALKHEDAKWGWNTAAPAIDVRFTSAAFKAQKYGFRTAVGDDDRRNFFGGGPALERRAAMYVAEKLMLNREVRAEAIVDASSMGSTTILTTSRWNSTASNPRADVNTAVSAILLKTGRKATVMIICGLVWDSITGTQSSGTAGAAITDAVKYTMLATGQALTPGLLAQYFNIGKVVPAIAVNSDPTKYETSTISTGLPEAGKYVWDKDEAYIFANDPNPGPQAITYGVSFGPTMFEADTYRDEAIKADWVRGTQILDEAEVCLAAGHTLVDLLA